MNITIIIQIENKKLDSKKRSENQPYLALNHLRTLKNGDIRKIFHIMKNLKKMLAFCDESNDFNTPNTNASKKTFASAIASL